MFSGFFLAMAVLCLILGIKLRQIEEVHAVAATCAGLLSSICSFIIAPPSIQLLLGLGCLGLIRFYPLRA